MGYIIAFILGAVIAVLIYKRLTLGGDLEMPFISVKDKIPTDPNHLKPIYFAYYGDYANINKCTGCGVTGLYEDMHTVNPCFNCGSKVVRDGAGKWAIEDGIRKWVKPE